MVTAEERDRVLLNPMVVLAREHMRQCGFSEEDVQQGSLMCTVGGPERHTRRGGVNGRAQAFVRDSVTAPSTDGLVTGVPRPERVSVGWGPARHA